MKDNDKTNNTMKKNTILNQALCLLGSHIGGIVVSLIFCFGLASLMSSTIGLIVSQIIIISLYSLPVYATMWDYGHKDLNRANYGHIKRDKYRGFKIGLIANIPFYILSVLLIISKFGLFYNIVILFKVLNSEIWPLINLIQPKAYMDEFSIFQVFLVAILPLIPVFIAGGAYILGNYDYSPMQRLVYKNKKKPTQKNKKQEAPTIKSKY